VLEFDLDEEELHDEVKFLAMAQNHSGKKYNARGLFEEMRVAWGLHDMKPARVLGDNKFMLEFTFEEIRRRIVDGGPWRHMGDTMLVVPYDGLSPPHQFL
jgi:hypothetical protein